MEIKLIQGEFAVCKIEDVTKVDFLDEFYFIGKTDEELSLVCLVDSVPKNTIECENGWNALRIQGVLDFALVGILAKISSLLAENEISIFAISTFNTDYILMKKQHLEKAISILRNSGYQVIN